MSKKDYNVNDLTTLSPGRAYRTKLGMYLSADLGEAINLGLRELIYNAQDEYEATKQKDAKVSITINGDEITVEDNMRGIPVGIREDGINSLEAAFLIPHSGAKHKEGTYTNAVGVNGQGSKIVCHTAEWLKVTVRREGKEHFLSFHETDEGAVIDAPIKSKKAVGKGTGTKISYKPSEIVYKGTKIDYETLRNTLRELSYFTRGLVIELKWNDKPLEKFLSLNGLTDGLSGTRVHSKPLSFHKAFPDCEVELALQWLDGKPGEIRPFANNLFVRDGGEFMTGFKSSLTRSFNNIAKTEFSGDQIRKYLDGYVSVKVREVQYSNQAKTSLANKEARAAASTSVTEALKEFATKHKGDFSAIVSLIEREHKAEEAADRARNAILRADKEIGSKRGGPVFYDKKLKDAVKLGEGSVLLLSEGDSASSTLITARDPNKYGVLSLRGKVISALANPLEKVLDNEEVRLIVSALGLSLKGYNPKDLRYGKVAIATDADADGSAITNLLIGLFYVLFPELLREGRVYRFHSPLYKIERGKKVNYYYTEEEAAKAPAGGSIERFKGLGSLSLEDAKEIFFNEGTNRERLEQLVWDEEASRVVNELLGKDVRYRKEYVENKIDFSESANEN